MGRYLLWTIPLFPVLELYILIQVGTELGVLTTVALVLLATAAGFFLLHLCGAGLTITLRKNLAQGQLSAGPLFDGFCLMVAGWLFLFPGLLSDFIALLLLLPPIRYCLLRLLSTYGKHLGNTDPTIHIQTVYRDRNERIIRQDGSRPHAVIIDVDVEEASPKDTSPGGSGTP
jgi:UPF0716 protein FxsA